MELSSCGIPNLDFHSTASNTRRAMKMEAGGAVELYIMRTYHIHVISLEATRVCDDILSGVIALGWTSTNITPYFAWNSNSCSPQFSVDRWALYCPSVSPSFYFRYFSISSLPLGQKFPSPCVGYIRPEATKCPRLLSSPQRAERAVVDNVVYPLYTL